MLKTECQTGSIGHKTMSICTQCQSDFGITQTDRQFYKKISPTFLNEKFEIPVPRLCPLCRAQRRYIWRGELNLFKKKSYFSGKEIITFYPPESQCKVLSAEDWWGDKWSALDYGKDFDFNKTFFEQFLELIKEVPLLALSGSKNAENTSYINCASWNKNCYLLAGANYNEDCYYGNYVNHSKSCIDNNFIDQCELCYECVDCNNCYDLRYSQNCQSCSESFFLQNCQNCKNCFGSVNLVGKQYYFFNQALKKEEYELRLMNFALDKYSNLQQIKILFDKHQLKFPKKYMIGIMNEDVTGNAISNSRNSHDCFDASQLWDCRYCSWFHQSKDCMDIVSWGFPAERCYECTEVGDSSNSILFSVSSYGSHNILYSYYSMYSNNCFGCVSMKKNSYCILNKQYTPVEYEKLLNKIIKHMQKTGEWGEFFPMKLSPLAYNSSIAQDYFPMDKQSVKSFGLNWHDEEHKEVDPLKFFIAPDSIKDAEDNICDMLLLCESKKVPFKITKQELKFYKKMNIPIPRLCFAARHEQRLAKRNPRQLWERQCAKCTCQIKTSYPPFKPEIVYCEKCYLTEVY